MTFSEKFNTPEFRYYRRRVIELKGKVCDDCGEDAAVPRIFLCGFYSNLEPWQYPLSHVKLLCYECYTLNLEKAKVFLRFVRTLHPETLYMLLEVFSILGGIDPLLQPVMAERLRVAAKQAVREIGEAAEEFNEVEGLEHQRWQLESAMLRLEPITSGSILDTLDMLEGLSGLSLHRAVGRVSRAVLEWEVQVED